jgi:Uma2 family endonuclease
MTETIDTFPVPSPRAPRMSYEAFLRSYEGSRAEWVDGEVVEMSPPSNRHQRIAAFLQALLQHFVEARHPGIVLGDFQMKPTRQSPGREPDLLFLANEHLDRLKHNNVDGPADLVVEIVSPDSVKRDRVVKRAEYEAGGVAEYWVVDPLRSETVFYGRAADGRYVELPVEDGVFRSRVLPGLWLNVEWLREEPMPPLMTVLRAWGLV